MTTIIDIDGAFRAAGLGWDIRGGLVTSADADGLRCNRVNCEFWLSLSTLAGVSVETIADAAATETIDGDATAVDAIKATRRGFLTELGSAGVGISVRNPSGDYGLITVWRVGARAATEVMAGVTTQDYFAQAALAAATLGGMAAALADLVGDPTADPVDAPDPTAFDAIMAA